MTTETTVTVTLTKKQLTALLVFASKDDLRPALGAVWLCPAGAYATDGHRAVLTGKIAAIRVRSFEYRAPEEITELPASSAVARTGAQIGVIAQELREVLPECVSEAANGMLSVSTDPLLWYLINAVQTLSAKVAQLEAERNAQ